MQKGLPTHLSGLKQAFDAAGLTHTLTHEAQNQWLRENTVDAHGNLLYCRDCLVACLGVHKSHIQRQRQIKQRQMEQPIVEMSKQEVEDRQLVDCVLREDDEVLTFAAWWKTVDKDAVVEVQYPHDHHGLAGKPSNHATERQKDYEHNCRSSVVAAFNRAQREKGRPTCSNTAARKWLHKHRPKVAIHPSMTDYCDTCQYLKEQLTRNQAIFNRMQQSGSASRVEMRAMESTKSDLEELR